MTLLAPTMSLLWTVRDLLILLKTLSPQNYIADTASDEGPLVDIFSS
ncbi:hypothetical protein PI124_g13680 [Phytophthora idaei]|nr:hypothetical protein PI125_g10556 [Phytophthora idaei]KAG3146147.1 hypothetical protein PI126_g13447 [Phytophthora idaei]KAG3241459.1 hypothetical protein PI124_g13680 [Phytophthora idaei]